MVVRHHHGHGSKQGAQVVRERDAASVDRVERDERGESLAGVYSATFKQHLRQARYTDYDERNVVADVKDQKLMQRMTREQVSLDSMRIQSSL